VRIYAFLTAFTLAIGLAGPAWAQFLQGEKGGAKVGETLVQKLQSGIIVSAGSGSCRGLVGYTAVPRNWPEQEVKIVDEEISPEAKVEYREYDGAVKLMIVRIPNLRAGGTAKALVTFEIRRSQILPPDDTDAYVMPDLRKLDRRLRVYLGTSPKIETRDRKIRALAKAIGPDEKTAWGRVEAIYDWVREKVEYKNGPLKGAVAALRDGTGDCEELTSLFIAICRAADIPARTVWVEGHCYPEFYLMDREGKGHWFPCQAAGTRSFGGIPELKPVLSKGDSFRPPHNRRDIQRYPADHLTGTGGRPRVKFIRKQLSK